MLFNCVRLVGKYAFFLAKLILAILMLISRKLVQKRQFFRYSPADTNGFYGCNDSYSLRFNSISIIVFRFRLFRFDYVNVS